MIPFEHPVQVYYEDTDHSGAVYHANYLRYFERAREHALGVDALVRLWHEQGVGFVVVRAELRYRAPARFGDALVVRTTVHAESRFRLVFDQRALRGVQALVEATVELCCVDRAGALVPVPDPVLQALAAARAPGS